MPRVTLTPLTRVALYALRIYLLLMLALIVLRFTHVLG
jgi:hypothetical protein